MAQWGFDLARLGLLADQRRQQEAARQQFMGLLGDPATPEQKTPFIPDMFPGETPEMLGGQQTSGMANVIPGQAGYGLLGGKITPQEFYGAMMTMPGYEQIGAQGLGSLLSPKQDKTKFDFANKLRDEFTKQAGDFVKVRDAYGRIQASLDKPSAASDIALIFNYIKMLDPGSTVREGEFATAQNATGVPGMVANLYNRALKGERLGEEQRLDFSGMAEGLYKSQEIGLSQLENQYTDLARRAQVDPEDVIVKYRAGYNREKKPIEIPPPPGTVKRVIR